MKLFIACMFVGLVVALAVGAVSAADPLMPIPAPAPAAADAGAPAPGGANNPDAWRYQFYSGYWWYWTPDNHWLCYMNGQWVSPGAPPQAGVAVPAYQYYNVVPQPYYYPYPYGYGYPYPYYGGGLYLGFGYGGYWGGYGGYHGGYYHGGGGGHGGHH